MKKTILGKDLEVSAVGLGCMGFTHAYGTAMDEQEAAKAIVQAVDMGYTYFDTAECYTGNRADGSLAYNEDLVGEALKPYRNKVVIASKCGVHHNAEGKLVMDSRPETIRKSVEGSLKRLQTDRIDLYYQHRIDPKIPAEEVAGVMADLMKEGKILHWGISETTEEYLRKAHAVCPVTCVQNRYSMMARWHGALFPALEELGVGYVAFSPLANGILSGAFGKGSTFENGDFRNMMPQYTDEAMDANQKLMDYIKALAEEKQATSAQISLAWMICKKSYIVPIPGSRKVERIRENAGAAEIELSAGEVAAIDEKLDHMEMSGVFGGSPVQK
ncbi:MAG: aldo/keto reductase [Oscillospiraceae bacterium]|nr:aldo/keto reductase [Oscillospiraceae bacterium]